MHNALFSAVTAVVSLLLAYRLYLRYRTRARLHTLMYTVSIALVGLAAAVDVICSLLGSWSPFLYALYWLMAGSLVGFMAVGSLYLVGRPAGHGALALVLLGVLYLAIQAFGAAVPAAAIPAGPAVATRSPEAVRAAFHMLSDLGATAVLVVATISWLRTRMAYNGWIILGVLLFSLAGIMGGRLESPPLFYGLQAIGSIALYRGVAGSLLDRPGARRMGANSM